MSRNQPALYGKGTSNEMGAQSKQRNGKLGSKMDDSEDSEMDSDKSMSGSGSRSVSGSNSGSGSGSGDSMSSSEMDSSERKRLKKKKMKKMEKRGKKDGKYGAQASDESRERMRLTQRGEKARKKKKEKRNSDKESRMMMKEEPMVRSTANSGAGASGAGASGSGSGVPGNIMLVKQMQPFSESIKWETTDYVVHVNASLRELEQRADANGNVPIGLGDSTVRIEQTSPGIHERVRSLNKLSASSMMASPAQHMSNEHVVRDAKIISAHNGFPLGIGVQLNNINASSKHVVYLSNGNQNSQNLTFSVQQGEKLNNHEVLSNHFESSDNFKFWSAFPDRNPKNLADGVIDGPAYNNVERKLVPHTADKPHPVVVLAQIHIKDDMTPEQIKTYNKTIPPELMSASKDTPGYYIMSKALFEKYRARCEKKLHESTPLSDVAFPHGSLFISSRDMFMRLGANNAGSASGSAASGATVPVSSKSRLDSDVPVASAKKMWTENPEIETNRVGPQSKENAKDIRYNFFARVRVRSMPTAKIAINN